MLLVPRDPELQSNARIFAVAPMMNRTDRHCRVLHRMLSARALLYTEMITSAAIWHGDRHHLLAFSAVEQPVALQLGGSDPAELALAARIGEEFGYREINLNCGCPSDRVKEGRFGACLMGEPERVADCVSAMVETVRLPVTVKCRLGIDDQSEEEPLDRFVETVAAAGCSTFIVHARKAWLHGLSPRENREIPPLNYERVYRLKASRSDLTIVLNGGVATLAEAKAHLRHVDGVMMGRAAYDTPYLLAAVDAAIFGDDRPPVSRAGAVAAYRGYVEAELARGVRLSSLVKPMIGLFHGEHGGRAFRRVLSEEAHRSGAGIQVLDRALAATTSAAFAVAAE